MVASAVIERIVAEEAAPKEMARSKSTCPEASSWPVRMLVGSRSQRRKACTIVLAVGAPESGVSPRDWRHSPPGEAAMVDEATTTKWHVKHGPTERRHASQSDASNLD